VKLHVYTPNGLRSSELHPFYSNAAICPNLISDCAMPNVFVISTYTCLQICRSWRCWNQHLMELLISTFASLYMFDHVLKTDENDDIVFKVRWWRCTRLQFLWARILSSWLRFNDLHG
jgi:hypothetical protein